MAAGICALAVSGCSTATGTATRSTPPGKNAPITKTTGNSPEETPVPRGTPEGLAHYAAGYSYEANDSPELARAQFEASVLADPSNEGLATNLARDFLKNNQTDRAIKLLSKAAQNPNASGELLSWLARADLKAGKTNDAVRASRLAIQRSPTKLEGYKSLLDVLYRTGPATEALRTLDEASARVNGDTATLISLADLYAIYVRNPAYSLKPSETKSATGRAMALLDRALSNPLFTALGDPKRTPPWTTKEGDDLLTQSRAIGDVYNRLGEPKKAADIYAKLVSSFEEPSILRNDLRGELANVYLELSDRTNAMKQLQAIVRDSPERYPGAWYALGRLAYEEARLSDAAEDFENAVHWDPSLQGAYFELALVQMDLHRTSDALRTLDLARGRFPNTFDGEFVTGLVYSHNKNYPEAVRHFMAAEVIGMTSDRKRLDQRFYFPFGAACERNGQFDQATEYLEKCVKMAPDFAEALNYLGYMWADRGSHLDRARDLIEKAVKLDPKNGAYLDSLGWVLFKLKKPDQALPFLLKAMEYTPEPDATVLDHLGEVYYALGKMDKARESWKKSLTIESNDDVKKKLERSFGGAS